MRRAAESTFVVSLETKKSHSTMPIMYSDTAIAADGFADMTHGFGEACGGWEKAVSGLGRRAFESVVVFEIQK